MAEACAELAGMVPPHMTSSLVLSMLQTLSADADASVRGGVAVNLGQMLSYLLDAEKVATVSSGIDAGDGGGRVVLGSQLAVSAANTGCPQ